MSDRHKKTKKKEEYELAFPKHPELEEIVVPPELVVLINELWIDKENDLRVLCFGYGFGQTEAYLLRAIEEVLKNSPRSNGKAQVVLCDTENSGDLFGALSDRPKIMCADPRFTYQYEWREGAQSSAVHDLEYDIVTAYFCLHFMPDWPSELRQLARHVKPGGLISFAIERGYRACIDGATRVDETNCHDCDAWRKYHDIRLNAGDGWLPDISASDLGVISLITAGDFTPVLINKSECLTIHYPDSKLDAPQLKKISGVGPAKGQLFFPLLNSSHALWKDDPQLKLIRFDSAPHKEKADIFFLKRVSSGTLWEDDVGYVNKVALALLSHSIGSQNRILVPVLQAGESDNEYLHEMRKKLRNILCLLGMHYLRHCQSIACEPVFVQYHKISELYSNSPGLRGYLNGLPMLVYGPKKWRSMHKKAYGDWRRYLFESSVVAWIGQYVMELFPWVGAWEICFNGNDDVTAAIKRHRYAPHLDRNSSVWRSYDQADILEIKIGMCCEKSFVGSSNDESVFEWIENTDTHKGDELTGKHRKQNEMILKALEGLFKKDEATPPLEELSGLLSKLAQVNCSSGMPWRKIYYLSIPQSIVRSKIHAAEQSGIGLVIYDGADGPYTPRFVDAILQFMPSIFRLSQLQFHYLYLHEKQNVHILSDEDSHHPGLTTKDIESLYSMVFPARGKAIVTVDLYGIHIQVHPIHTGVEFDVLEANLKAILSAIWPSVKLNSSQVDSINGFFESGFEYATADQKDDQKDDKIHVLASHLVSCMHGLDSYSEEIKFLAFKAKLGRFKGSFVPVDLAIEVHLAIELHLAELHLAELHLAELHLAIELQMPSLYTRSTISNELSYRAANKIQNAFWYLKEAIEHFIKAGGSCSYSYLSDECGTLIYVKRKFEISAKAKEYIEFCGAVIRGEVLYGSQQKIIHDIMELRKIFGCNTDLGVYDMGVATDRGWYKGHGKKAAGARGIAIWLSRIDNEVDLVLWIKHQETKK